MRTKKILDKMNTFIGSKISLVDKLNIKILLSFFIISYLLFIPNFIILKINKVNIYNSFFYSIITTLIIFFFLLLINVFLKSVRFNNYLYLIIYLILALVSFLELSIFYIFKTNITKDLFYILFETNKNESASFIRMYFDILLFFKILIILIVPFIINYLIVKLFNNKLSKIFLIIIICFFTFLVLLNFNKSLNAFNSPDYNIYKLSKNAYQDFLKESVIYNDYQKFIVSDLKGKISNLEKEATYVLIIGESTTRNHMGIYGYPRDTTPQLKKRDNLFVFNDVVSPASHTLSSLRKVLTLKSVDKKGEYYEYPDIINIFKEAGFETYWLSNQETSSIYGNFVSKVAIKSDYFEFQEMISSAGKRKSGFDEDVVYSLEKIIKKPNPKKFIVLHLMGTHGRYKDRYPSQFNKFINYDISINNRNFLNEKKKNTINEYDNAVLYNDYIVDKIIDNVKKTSKNSFVLYFSDHGEEVYDTRDFCGHTQVVGSRFMVEIPFLIWISDYYKNNHKSIISGIKRSIEKPYMIDDLPYTLMELASINFAKFDPSRSLINHNYNPERKRIIGLIDYDKEWKKKNFEDFITNNRDKVFLHRTSTIDKLKLLEDNYNGFEVDAVYDEKIDKFDLFHPPAESIGLYFEDFLSEVKNLKSKRIWFDLKNLNNDNKYAIFKKLRSIQKKFKLDKNQLILESGNFNSLNIFSEYFYTSYYLAYSNLNNLPETEQIEKAKLFLKNIKNNKTNAISFPIYNYNFVKKYIEPNIDENIDFLTWGFNKNNNWQEILKFRSLLDEDRIKVVLISEETKYDR